jgi:hypothetical protein
MPVSDGMGYVTKLSMRSTRDKGDRAIKRIPSAINKKLFALMQVRDKSSAVPLLITEWRIV